MRYQPRGITEKTVAERVQRSFAIGLQRVEFRPLGEGSWLYKLRDTEGRHYMLKINNELTTELVDLVAFLDAQPAVHSLRFLCSRSGARLFRIGYHNAVLYEYVDGEPIGDRALSTGTGTAIGRMLGTLHAVSVPDQMGPGIYVERFNRCRARARRVLIWARRYQQSPGIQGRLATFLNDHGDRIESHFFQSRALGRRLRDRPLVVTHGDAHPWNVIGGDPPRLIDWDGCGFALPERDLMHYADTPNWDAVLAGYRTIFPRFAANEHAIEYYRHEWVLQEIADYGEQILFHPISDRDREVALRDLADYF